MFYDQSVNDGKPLSLYRVVTSLATVILVPPFNALAVAPMLLLLLPVTFVAIPFMIPAFFPAAASTTTEFQKVPAWRSEFAMQLGGAHR